MLAALFNILLYLLAVVLIVGLVHYVADAVPLRDPFNRLVKLIATVAGVVILIIVILQALSGGVAELPRL